MANADRDQNRVPVQLGVSSSDFTTPTKPAVNPTSHAWLTEINNALITTNYDYISVSYDSATQETYTFKSGGSGGSTVATIVVVYTDSTKDSLSTVTKT